MIVRLSNIDKIDACALPALLTAYISVVARNADLTDILAKLNSELEGFGLPAISYSAFSRWTLKVRAGKVKRPEVGIHTRQDIAGGGQSVGTMQVPQLFNPALHGLDVLQVRVVKYPGSDAGRGDTVSACTCTWREVAYGAGVQLAPEVIFEEGKFYSVFVTAVGSPRRCLAGLVSSEIERTVGQA